MSQPRPVQFRFESAGLPSTLFRVSSLRVVEALNEPFRAEVTLAVVDPDADLAELLGRDATLTLERGSDVRRVVGLVRHVEEAEAAGNTEVTVVVVPALYMLSMRRNTRMFQEKTAVEILETVLKEALGPYGRAFRVELNSKYARREYCIQYEETDLEFVHRLMEEEGIGYAFEHEGDPEVMVLRERLVRRAALGRLGPVRQQQSRGHGRRAGHGVPDEPAGHHDQRGGRRLGLDPHLDAVLRRGAQHRRPQPRPGELRVRRGQEPRDLGLRPGRARLPG